MLSEIMIEQIAKKLHDSWYEREHADGKTSHMVNGVEVMKPWELLCEDMRALIQQDVVNMLTAMEQLHYRVTYTTPRWVIAEFMGRRRTAGMVSEVEQYGVRMGRIEVPNDEGDGVRAIHDFNGTAVFMLTACSEEKARAVARAVDINPTSDLDIVCARCGANLDPAEDGPLCESCVKKSDFHDE